MEAKKKVLYKDVLAIVLVLAFIAGVGCYLVRSVFMNVRTELNEDTDTTTSWSIHISLDTDDWKDFTEPFNWLQKGDPSAEGKKSEVKRIRLFAAGPDLPQVRDREYNDKFDQQEVRYVYTEVTYKNAFYKVKDGEINAVIQYFSPDGSLLAENKRTVHPKKKWSSALFVDKCGYEKQGQWQPGKYKVKVFMDGDLAGECFFEIFQPEAMKQLNLL